VLTLITPCLNARPYIADMLASVRAQRGVAFEHIVLDGGSSDGTREILANCRDVRLTAEPDAGSHDAMNKGIRLARGEILAFIGADDLYAPGVLAAVAARFAAEPALDALLCRSYLFAEDAGAWRVVARYPLGRGDGFDLAELMYGTPCINARFFRRRVFERAGGFENEFSFAADRHFLIRLALSQVRGAVPRRSTASTSPSPRPCSRRRGRRATAAPSKPGALTSAPAARCAPRGRSPPWPKR
jgi:glycosyltransferase involved in cell wall biosynthesis